MGGVGGLAPEDTARARRRRRAAAATASCGSAPRSSRCAAASSGCPGTLDVQRVLHRARGVVGRDVERLEVVPVVLDLGALGHAEPEAREHADDLALDDRERVQRAGPAGGGPAARGRRGRPRGARPRPGGAAPRGGPRARPCSAARTSFARCPTSRRSSSESPPSAFWTWLNGALRPSTSTWAASSSSSVRGRREPRRGRASRSVSKRAAHLAGVHQAAESSKRPVAPRAAGSAVGELEVEREPPVRRPRPRSVRPAPRRRPARTKSPILLPAPSPGRRGDEQRLGRPGRRARSRRREAQTCEGPVAPDGARSRTGPSRAHHTSDSMNARSVVLQPGGVDEHRDRLARATRSAGGRGRVAAPRRSPATSSPTSTCSGKSSRFPPTTRAASTSCRRIVSIRSASCTIPCSISARCSSVICSHRFSSA